MKGNGLTSVFYLWTFFDVRWIYSVFSQKFLRENTNCEDFAYDTPKYVITITFKNRIFTGVCM